MNPYEILNLKGNCSDDEIKAAFKAASLKYHPDRPNGGDSAMFNMCVKSKDILLNPESRHVYNRGGIEALKAYEERKAASNIKKCPNFEIEIEVSLEDLYNENTIIIDRDLSRHSKFHFELKLNFNMINKHICLPNQGITNDDYVTGDVILIVTLTNSKFKINNSDLILDVEIEYLDLLNFTINIDHPSNKKYFIKSVFQNPDENGNMVLYYPGLGINKSGSMIVCITPNLKNLKQIDKELIDIIRDTFIDSFKFNEKEQGQDITNSHTLPVRQNFSNRTDNMQEIKCPVQ